MLSLSPGWPRVDTVDGCQVVAAPSSSYSVPSFHVIRSCLARPKALVNFLSSPPGTSTTNFHTTIHEALQRPASQDTRYTSVKPSYSRVYRGTSYSIAYRKQPHHERRLANIWFATLALYACLFLVLKRHHYFSTLL